MKKIPLTHGKFTLVDDEDYNRLSEMGKWLIDSMGYAVKGLKVKREDGSRGHKRIAMHRLILSAPNNLTVDHINGDKLDNRKSNLRLCSQAENGRNRLTQKNNTSGYKGVYLHRKSGKYKVGISVNKKYLFLGYFSSKEEAALAYNAAALIHHGEFAKLNQI